MLVCFIAFAVLNALSGLVVFLLHPTEQ
jgi:hypothetical protein